MATVFVDEAGYTGPDLCDHEQPVFVLASHDWSEDEAADLKRRYFGGVRIPLKYGKLKRRGGQRRMVLEFLGHVAEHADRVRLAAADKRFAMIGRAVDLIVEPAMADAGHDLYDQGGNLALTNLIYHTALAVGGPAFYAELTRGFQALLRSPGEATYNALDDLLNSKSGVFEGGTRAEVLGEVLELVHYPLMDLSREYVESLSGREVDVSFTLALSLIAGWSGRHRGELDVVHDQSSNMSKQRDQWERIVSTDVQPAVIGSDRRTMSFPIGVRRTRFDPDQDWAGLQLADVLAGVTEDVLRTKVHGAPDPDPFVGQLLERMGEVRMVEHVWPQADFTPQGLGTVGPKFTDAHAFIGRLLSTP